MILKPIFCSVIIVSLSDACCNDFITYSKVDYITHKEVCQEKERNTLEYNTIDSKEYIESNNQKYQDILLP